MGNSGGKGDPPRDDNKHQGPPDGDLGAAPRRNFFQRLVPPAARREPEPEEPADTPPPVRGRYRPLGRAYHPEENREEDDFRELVRRLQEEAQNDVFVLPEDRITVPSLRGASGNRLPNVAADVILDYMYWRQITNNLGRPLRNDWNSMGRSLPGPFERLGIDAPPEQKSGIVTRRDLEILPEEVKRPLFEREDSYIGSFRDGPEVEYDVNGNILLLRTRHEGRLHGKQITTFAALEGMKRYDICRNGSQIGPITVRYANERLFFRAEPIPRNIMTDPAQARFVDSVFSGYYKSGALMFRANMTHREFDGEFLVYYENGRLMHETQIVPRESLIRRKTFSQTGELLREEEEDEDTEEIADWRYSTRGVLTPMEEEILARPCDGYLRGILKTLLFGRVLFSGERDEDDEDEEDEGGEEGEGGGGGGGGGGEEEEEEEKDPGPEEEEEEKRPEEKKRPEEEEEDEYDDDDDGDVMFV